MVKLKARVTFLLFSGMAVLPAAALAEAVQTSQPELPYTSPSNMAGSVVWVIFSLLLIIGLIIVVIKWLSRRNRAFGGTNRSLRSLGGISLGQNHSLQVVELSGRLYVVGVGESITLLDKIDDAKEAEAIIEAMERQVQGGWSPSALTGLISRFRQGSGEQEPQDEQWNDASSFQNVLKDKMNRQADRKQQLEALLKDPNPNERLNDDHEK
ncbi:flagellar protein FliO/FliZ [Paenibacillus algorifonticola]|uniref:Flagellar protein FliO/FliZ n=1 Tax=Paenibacillus algorifonticola TaxID=684063 RepID=A0A1I1YEZ1_9BACL|nr:flagellar biosynthetic protein FliO [Paenibacillus algorifonticola]SFE16683.1 flagellar protein FliO/FliZ [Paenibacillus algorifonticola]